MECERLIRLIKDWYLRVKQETMAPARMMQFVDQHVKNCPVCKKDLLLPEEVEKVREIVFPESKLSRNASGLDQETAEPDVMDEEEQEDFDSVAEVDELGEEEPPEEELNDDDII